MKSWKVVIIIVLFFSILYLVHYLEVIDMLANKVPLLAHLEYVRTKMEYNCGGWECTYKIQKCTEQKTNADTFVVSGAYTGGSGSDTYFYGDGRYICKDYWIIEDCRGGPCPRTYQGCPPLIESCVIIKKS